MLQTVDFYGRSHLKLFEACWKHEAIARNAPSLRRRNNPCDPGEDWDVQGLKSLSGSQSNIPLFNTKIPLGSNSGSSPSMEESSSEVGVKNQRLSSLRFDSAFVMSNMGVSVKVTKMVYSPSM